MQSAAAAGAAGGGGDGDADGAPEGSKAAKVAEALRARSTDQYLPDDVKALMKNLDAAPSQVGML